MKILVYALFCLLLLNSCSSNSVSETLEISKNDTSSTITVEEFFEDSLWVGQPGKYKIQIIKNRVNDSLYTEIIFFEILNNEWIQVQKLNFTQSNDQTLNVDIKDYNNDGFNDITYHSHTSMRGGNSIRNLLIFDKDNSNLRWIKNSENYPNIDYNEELNCISACILTARAETLFLRIKGDSLIHFAGVDQNDSIQIYKVDEFGDMHTIEMVSGIGYGYLERFTNFNPLKLEWEHYTSVSNFVRLFKLKDKEGIAEKVKYPFELYYPLPSIKSKTEFINQFDNIYDDSLISIIANSHIMNDWGEVGWRGIMLNYGIVWLNDDGKLTRLNYESEIQKEKRILAIENEKQQLHKSIRNFDEPILCWNTEWKRIRVDVIGDTYRYTSWDKSQSTYEEPNEIIFEGHWFPDGSGGNHHYEFIKGKELYRIDVIVMGKYDSPVGTLTIYKNDEVISREDGIYSFNQ